MSLTPGHTVVLTLETLFPCNGELDVKVISSLRLLLSHVDKNNVYLVCATPCVSETLIDLLEAYEIVGTRILRKNVILYPPANFEYGIALIKKAISHTRPLCVIATKNEFLDEFCKHRCMRVLILQHGHISSKFKNRIIIDSFSHFVHKYVHLLNGKNIIV